MAQQDISILFALLRSGLQGTPLTEAEQADLTTEQLPKLTALAKKFDVEHLLALGLRQNGWEYDQRSILVAALRCQRLQDAQMVIEAAFERAEIPFLPLKGAVLRQLYPEPWMRTSCDLDILVQPEDVERAATLLEETCGFTREKLDSHDLSLYSPNKAHLELHYDLIEQGLVRNADQVLAKVWEQAIVKEGSRCHYQMPDDLFYCYHIAHMAKHFYIGGCGIRPLLDLWILDQLPQADENRRDALLEQAGLLPFAKAARSLGRAWFAKASPEPIAAQMEMYILQGGLYADNQNRIAIQQHKQGGKLRFLLVRIFLPFDVIKFRYPVLQKHPWLMPVMQVCRWFQMIFGGHLGRIRRDLAYGWTITGETERKTKEFLEKLGLLTK